MRKCLKCGERYSDDTLNFCLNDGELLIDPAGYDPPPTLYADDSPPTILMNQPRATNPIGWAESQPPAPWGQNLPAHQQQQQMFGQYSSVQTASQTLAVVSLGLGIASMTVGWCCSLGLVLAPGALITGFIALSQIKKDPSKHTGRGFALGGVITGAVFLVLYVLMIVLYGAAMLFGGIA